MKNKEIKDYENYSITSNGQVIRNGKVLRQWKNHRGYPMITLSKNGNQKSFSVHRLVALAFIPNPENKEEVDHINTIKSDNRVENLRWVTKKENNQNTLTKLHNSECRKGEKHYNYGKYLSLEVKKKMLESHMGHPTSEETKRKIGKANKGKIRSEEFRKNISDKLVGRFMGGENHNSKAICQYSKDKEKIKDFYSISNASRELGIGITCIVNCLRGKSKTAGGYIWKYKD